MTSLHTLDINGCWILTLLPECISALDSHSLHTLDLDGSWSLTLLLEGISALTALETLRLNGCGSLISLPESISALTRLEVLDLNGGNLEGLPGGIKGCRRLSGPFVKVESICRGKWLFFSAGC